MEMPLQPVWLGFHASSSASSTPTSVKTVVVVDYATGRRPLLTGQRRIHSYRLWRLVVLELSSSFSISLGAATMATSSPFTTWQDALLHAQDAWTDVWQLQFLPYATSNAFAVALQLLLAVIALTWLASVVTRNYSFTDRLWSITPGIFAWHFAYHAYVADGVWDQRLVLMAVLTTLWGGRLTFNFWRKGGYKLSEEDYRWAVVRQYMHWTLFEVLNVVFIAGYQHLLLLLLTVPSYVVYFHRHQELNVVDAVAAALFLLLLLLETVADQQQWVFYKKKYELIAQKKPLTGDYKAGFNRSGLFRYSRHPNFFGEISLWWAFYLFSAAVPEPIFNPSSLGTILLTLLFQGSAPFTEYITASKYPMYKEYQRRVSMLIPWFPLPSSEDDVHDE